MQIKSVPFNVTEVGTRDDMASQHTCSQYKPCNSKGIQVVVGEGQPSRDDHSAPQDGLGVQQKGTNTQRRLRQLKGYFDPFTTLSMS